MAVKTYKTKSIQKAIHQIKKDMGPDALILSTRRIPKGAQNPNGGSLFEVSAAPQEAQYDPAGRRGEAQNYDVDDYVLNLSEYHSKKASPVQADTGHGTIRQELVNIKEMLFLLNETQGIPPYFSDYPECLNIYARLIQAGISEARAQYFIKKSCLKNNTKNPEKGEIAGRVIREVLQTVSVGNLFQFSASAQKKNRAQMVGFVGPTGVGKTTTIAKIAADLSLKQKKKVGLISIDNFRIGAVEQLKTYAAIIGLPCITAFTKEDLQKAAGKMRNRDVILVDTAGQNHLDKKRMEILRYFLSGDPSISCHLVLSATTKREDMKDAAMHFSQLKPKTYIFTKADETKQRGGIIDQVLDMKLPVSFVTNGQKVPEDILPATRKNLSQLVFRP